MWFDEFARSLRGADVAVDLVGAGDASAERAMAHYRFQHRAKIQEALEDHFGVLKSVLGEKWESLWSDFWDSQPASPRSLDFFGEVFLSWLHKTHEPVAIKELARFEHALEVHDWTQIVYPLVQLTELTGDERIELVSQNFQTYEVKVAESYQKRTIAEREEKQHIYIWLTSTGTHYRAMSAWEIELMKKLPQGLGAALDSTRVDESGLAEFFQWLGSSGAIRSMA